MTFILTDTLHKDSEIEFTNLHWRSLAKEINRSKILCNDRSDKIMFHLCTEIKVDEAKKISLHFAKLLETNELPSDISNRHAELLCTFANRSNGFEVC